MRRMRFLVAILIIWLFFFYNIERLSEPVDISRVAYTMVPFMAAATILVPRLRQVPLGVLLVAPVPVFVALKTWMGMPVWGTALPLTVTELCATAVTTILARWVSNGVSEFERAISRITIGQIDELPEPFSTGQAKMYQEVKRARNHQRPLALMAVGIEEESIQVALDRMVQEVQQAMMKRYVLSDVARTLCDELEDYNIIAQGNNHFLALLPEVTSDQLPDLADRLSSTVSEQVGVTLKIGTACFPEDSVTFESLVKKAVEEMNEKLKPGPTVRPQRLATEHHIHSSIYKEENQWS
jgi:GGDEF domain-containing protein